MLVSAMIATVLVGLQGGDANPWVTYVSKEGQFVVDLPTQPTSSETKTSNGPNGRTRNISVECETAAVVYIVRKVVMSTAVVKGAEDRLLNLYRQVFAEMFNGKVMSEKKVRYDGGLPGRDFTVRGRAGRGGEVATIRVRMYLSGQSIFALMAVAAPNRELPADTGRFFGSFAIGTARQKKSAPKAETEPEGKPIAGWGSAVDPDGDCQIDAEGKALVVKVPGTLHDLNADIDKYNAPRVLREVVGDFMIQVKVVGDFTPGAKSLNPKSVPYNGAGIFVWRDSDNFIRLERGAIIRKGKLGTFATFEEREGGSRGAQHNGNLTPGTAYLRMERRGSRISAFVSKDGKHWSALRPIDTVWPAELKVGVDAINSSDAPFTVRFEELSFRGKTRSAKP